MIEFRYTSIKDPEVKLLEQDYMIHTIAPAEELLRGQEISYNFMVEKQGRTKDPIEKMLPDPLSPSGEEPATHYKCTLYGTQSLLDSMLEYVGEQEDAFCRNDLTIDSDPEDLTASFIVIGGDLDSCDLLLSRMGLKEI